MGSQSKAGGGEIEVTRIVFPKGVKKRNKKIYSQHLTKEEKTTDG